MNGGSLAARNTLDYLWFWNFWCWSVESFRSGALLHDPAHGIAGHWDEWHRYDASADDRAAVADIASNPGAQRAFVIWLARCWGPEVRARSGDVPMAFTLGQLAQVPPFRDWPAFSRYRSGYGLSGLSAIVLAEGSAGEPSDVRRVEALLLPRDSQLNAPTCVAEGFQAKENDLELPRQAAMSLLAGRGLAALSLRWLVAGERPYPRWLWSLLAGGWVGVAALIVFLLIAPDPGDRIYAIAAALTILWSSLVLIAIVTAASLLLGARRGGQHLLARLTTGEVRLRMNGGITLIGGSAGLPFCLEMLLATYRAAARARHPGWVWARSLASLQRNAGVWAATGAVTAGGRISPVLLDAKLRALHGEPRIRSILIPSQAGMRRARNAFRADVASGAFAATGGEQVRPQRGSSTSTATPLQIHACRSVAGAVFAASGMRNNGQIASNAVAVVISLVMLAALPDLRTLLIPPRPPRVVPPASPSPYLLWVSLDTPTPDAFSVVLESQFWSRRRARLTTHPGTNDPPRAELLLRRVPHQTSASEEDGTVWVERRRHFLSRELRPGARVGRYTLTYLFRLSYEH